MAATDALTGLLNRGRFDEHLAEEWRRAVRTDQPLSLLLIDVDRFKAVNDNCGHAAGDECLRRIARIISSSAQRATDFAARYDGDELVRY